jgi:hypothetical protein
LIDLKWTIGGSTHVLLTLLDEGGHELGTGLQKLQELLLLLWPWVVLECLQELLDGLFLRGIAGGGAALWDHVRLNLPRHRLHHLR